MKKFKLDKTAVKKGSIKSIGNDFGYWSQKSFEERLAAIDYLRKLNYPELNEPGYKMQRVYKFVKRKSLKPLLIMVSGPYSADSQEQMQENLEKLNSLAVEVYQKGHIPVIGVHNGLPVSSTVSDEKKAYETMMHICCVIAERCDAILIYKSSKGADMEKDIFIQNNKPVFTSIEQIPVIN